MTDYKKQYLKYKNKYLKIKKMLGGIGGEGTTKQEKIKEARILLIKAVEAVNKAQEQEDAVVGAADANQNANPDINPNPNTKNNFTKIGTGLTFIGGLIAVLFITLKN